MTGMIVPFGGTTAPSGTLLCNGAAVSRTTYANLFTVIGTAYGAGDGTTTFNVPDGQGRHLTGYAATGGHADVSTMGGNEGTALASRRPRHGHTNGLTASASGLTLPNHVHSLSDPGHGHSVYDPGHDHSFEYYNQGGDQAGAWMSPNNFNSFANASNGSYNQSAATGISIYASGTGISVGNPTSNPPVSGSVSVSGTIGLAGPMDSAGYLVCNYVIVT
jgi:microcystin-dependent protein